MWSCRHFCVDIIWCVTVFRKYSNACAPYKGVGIAQSVLSYGLDGRGNVVRCPEGQEIYVVEPTIRAVHWYRVRVLQS